MLLFHKATLLFVARCCAPLSLRKPRSAQKELTSSCELFEVHFRILITSWSSKASLRIATMLRLSILRWNKVFRPEKFAYDGSSTHNGFAMTLCTLLFSVFYQEKCVKMWRSQIREKESRIEIEKRIKYKGIARIRLK